MKSAANVSRRPAIGRLFLIAMGTPANGRSSPPEMASASARASSANTSTKALRSPSSSSMRASEASTSSRLDSVPSRMSAARSIAERNRTSSSAMPPIYCRAVRNRLSGYLGVMADLPEVLDLPLAGGAGYWYWLGGRPATDFVNTLRERWRRRVETLATPADLGLWLHRAGLLEAPPDAVPAPLLGEAR